MKIAIFRGNVINHPRYLIGACFILSYLILARNFLPFYFPFQSPYGQMQSEHCSYGFINFESGFIRNNQSNQGLLLFFEQLL
jgi:hypothetical protein